VGRKVVGASFFYFAGGRRNLVAGGGERWPAVARCGGTSRG
jgi:hypothetical protein